MRTADDKSQERDSDTTAAAVSYWTDDRGRTYVSDNSVPVPLHKLTAYAEYGDAALDTDHIHHALGAGALDDGVYVDAPAFLVPLDADEHQQLHAAEERTEVEGLPLLVPDEEAAAASGNDPSANTETDSQTAAAD